MYDKGRERINVNQVIELLVNNGFKDSSEDVLISSLALLNKVATHSALSLGPFMNDLIQKIANKYNIHIKSVKKSEKAENISRAIIKSVFYMNNSSELQDGGHQMLVDFTNVNILQNADGKTIYEEIKAQY
jgi:hypothetical protein